MNKTSHAYQILAEGTAPDVMASLDRLIDNHQLALLTILQLRTQWERHSPDAHKKMEGIFKRFVDEHIPKLEHPDIDASWPIAVPPAQQSAKTNASDEVIERVVRAMVARGDLFINVSTTSNTLAPLISELSIELRAGKKR